MKHGKFASVAAAAALSLAQLGVPADAEAAGRGNDKPLLTVYVSSQGLYYDSFVSAERLPPRGKFQQLVPGGMGMFPSTEFGPGDPGYVGGRWWVDNGDGVQDEMDTYFSCPLLGPGRTDP